MDAHLADRTRPAHARNVARRAIGSAAVRALALVVVALLAGCATNQPYGATPPTSRPSARPSADPAPTCPASGVLLQVDGVNAAMGLRALGITLINCGRTPYRVDSYPEVLALDNKHAPLDVTVLRGVGDIAPGLPIADTEPRPLVLKPGEHAGAAIFWRNRYDDTRRPPVNAELLRVAPQAGRPSQILLPEGGLDLGSTGRLGVSPWIPSPTEARSTPSRTAPASAPPAVSAPPASEEPPLL